ncbi:hybrid sensor histidine kinase/response regulator transcription factor [Kriegella aquimaris]|uniref:histidine kinase n=1 Tax=Kriegella aquimaris TaxID=192904 RepID=A0A1G9Q0G4_9FLAO|nr:two-component regulator propeller domain-containing protein [Kriegella aquimaris]SDM04221.1 Signal transduction histidine kinase [Kriegella aquimaris]
MRKSGKRKALLLFIEIAFLTLIISPAVYSQKFERFSNEEGFNQNTIYTIEQDQYGYLWYGTPNGLIRYDGYEFKTYTTQSDTDGHILSNYITRLYNDNNGILWIGTNLGLNVYIPSLEKFFTVPLPNKLHINTIASGLKGQIWFSGKNELYVCELKNIDDGIFNTSDNLLKLLPDFGSINDFSFRDDGSLLMATSKGLKLLKLSTTVANGFANIKTSFVFESFENEMVTEILKKENIFWIRTERALNKATFEGNKVHVIDTFNNLGNPESLDTEFVINTLFEDHSGAVWIGTKDDGLFKYEDGHFKHFAYDPKNSAGLSSKHINALYEDDFDVLWIGTAQAGINKLDLTQKKFISYSHNPYEKSSLSDNLLMAILEDSHGKLWLSGYNRALFRSTAPVNDSTVDKLEFEDLDDKLSLANNDVVRSIYEDKRGYVWIGSDLKLVVFNPSNNQFKEVVLEHNGNKSGIEKIRKIYQIDENSMLLAGTQIAVVTDPWRAIDKSKVPRLELSSSLDLKSENVQALLEVEPGSFWFGTNKGLMHGNFDGEKITIDQKITDESTNEIKLTYRNVFSLLEDNNGAIWVGTFGGGLSKMSVNAQGVPVKMEHFRKNDFLPDDAIYGILQEGEDYLWMSTDMGLVRLYLPEYNIDVFDVRDGLPQNNFRQGAYFKGKSGYFYFGGLNGLTVFNPEDITLNTKPPEILITDLLVDNKSVRIGEKLNSGVVLAKSISETESIAISQKQQIIAFNLAVEHTSTPSKNKLAYKLEGFNDTWIEENTGKTTVTYTNLSAGNYIFKIKAANGDGIWNTKAKLLHVQILPPWYQTWWSYLLFTLLIVGAGIGVVVYFTQHEKLKQRLKYEKLDKERQDTINQGKFRYFTNLSHEFRTPLTLIAGPLEYMISHNSDAGNNKYLEIVRKNTKRLLSLVDQLITFRQAEQGHLNLHLNKDTLGGFMYPTTEGFENYAVEKDINFYYKVSTPDEEIVIDVEKTERIIFNLLSNSFKNTPPKGSISVESRITFDSGQKMIHIDVIDNGKGIPKEDLENIFERFYQLGNKSQSTSGGGIGLSFCKSLVTLLGGEISATSDPGIETRFSVAIPSKAITESGKDSISRSEKSFIKDWIPLAPDIIQDNLMTEKNGATKEYTILIVENEIDVQTFLLSTLSQKYNIVIANNGVEGLEKIEQQEPDLVISDVMMPEMDGFEFCEKIKSSAELSHISVLLLTALGDKDDVIKGLEFGADEYISKPFSLRHLELRIERLIQNKKKLRHYFSKNSGLPKGDLEISTRDKEFLKNTIEAIEKNISDSNFGVEELAAEIGLSTSHFYRRLKQLTGQVPNVYLRNFRLQRAAKLLSDNEGFNVAEVMYQIGIESNSYFSTSFKKLHGVSPSEFSKKK